LRGFFLREFSFRGISFRGISFRGIVVRWAEIVWNGHGTVVFTVVFVAVELLETLTREDIAACGL
jgi:hypothetical protein